MSEHEHKFEWLLGTFYRCHPCGALEEREDPTKEIANAASAIVDAADKHHDYLPHTVRAAVDAWRKLKGKG